MKYEKSQRRVISELDIEEMLVEVYSQRLVEEFSQGRGAEKGKTYLGHKPKGVAGINTTVSVKLDKLEDFEQRSLDALLDGAVSKDKEISIDEITCYSIPGRVSWISVGLSVPGYLPEWAMELSEEERKDFRGKSEHYSAVICHVSEAGESYVPCEDDYSKLQSLEGVSKIMGLRESGKGTFSSPLWSTCKETPEFYSEADKYGLF
jgi:hypothetical protein